MTQSVPVRNRTRTELYRDLDLLRSSLGYPIERPCDPYALAARLGCDVAAHTFDSPHIGGVLLRSGQAFPSKRGIILLNDARLPQAQRFTLAHELVHFALHTERREFFCAVEQTDRQMEWQANEGASELLLPHRLLGPMLAAHRYAWAAYEGEWIGRIAREYGVSATVVRIRAETLMQCAGCRAPEGAAD